MGSDCVVGFAPIRAEIPGMPDARETVLVQELVTDTTVQALGERVLLGFARPNEVVLDSVQIGPRVEGFAGELRSVVGPDSLWLAVQLNGPV